MGYRIWLPQLKRVVRSRDVVFNEARLHQNNCASKHDHKKVKFQHDQPPIRPNFDPQDVPHMTENVDDPVVFEPDDVGQHHLDNKMRLLKGICSHIIMLKMVLKMMDNNPLLMMLSFHLM